MQVTEIPEEIASLKAKVAELEAKIGAMSLPKKTAWQNKEFLTPKETSEVLSVAESTLKSWRSKGIGPASSKTITGKIYYKTAVVRGWVDRDSDGLSIAKSARKGAKR